MDANNIQPSPTAMRQRARKNLSSDLKALQMLCLITRICLVFAIHSLPMLNRSRTDFIHTIENQNLTLKYSKIFFHAKQLLRIKESTYESENNR